MLYQLGSGRIRSVQQNYALRPYIYGSGKKYQSAILSINYAKPGMFCILLQRCRKVVAVFP
jgi:hypothetical protein